LEVIAEQLSPTIAQETEQLFRCTSAGAAAPVSQTCRPGATSYDSAVIDPSAAEPSAPQTDLIALAVEPRERPG
jgi:hypothetical protein